MSAEKEGKLVSIIMPCYNQGKYIDEAIKSVLNSTYKNVEVIVVNDGSTDEYTNFLLKNRSWEKTIVFNTENRGVCVARNFAVQESKGEYILPLDADDKIAPEYIEKAINILNDNPNVKVVCCDVEMFGVKKGKYPLPQHSIEMLLGQNTMVVSSMFRREDFNKTIGFNPNMREGFEDWDLWLSLLENDGEVFKLNIIGFYYRISRRSRNNSLDLTKYSRLRKQIYYNHTELYANCFFNPTNSFEYDLIVNSKEFRFGNFLLNPVRRLIKFFNNNS